MSGRGCYVFGGGSPELSVPLLGGGGFPSPTGAIDPSLRLIFINVSFKSPEPDAGRLCKFILKGDVAGFRKYCSDFTSGYTSEPSIESLKDCMNIKVKNALKDTAGLSKEELASYSSCSGATLYLSALILCNVFFDDERSYQARFNLCQEIAEHGMSNNTRCKYEVCVDGKKLLIATTPENVAELHDARKGVEQRLLPLVQSAEKARRAKPLPRSRGDSGSATSLEVARYFGKPSPRGVPTHPFADFISVGGRPDARSNACLVLPAQQ